MATEPERGSEPGREPGQDHQAHRRMAAWLFVLVTAAFLLVQEGAITGYDGRTMYGGQCLSFISLKVHQERGLMLTAMYRNHTYITRCLGNLIGLSRLQAFIAKESGLAAGPLTVISTQATLDTGKGWGITDARALVTDAQRILSGTSGASGVSSTVGSGAIQGP